ncbi:hypothetical protein MRB53_010399 [Persea americana]|uniref:Uncharacterized protein n=1 Tax=Persea americana TaxID=3435 RepID=A0ACC2LRT1_PERAE|nr:hypothetical protein MRB53_010399 [Persea americana]
MFGARPQSGVGQIDAEWLREAYNPERRRILNKWARNQADFLAKLRARVPDFGGLPVRGCEGGPIPTMAGARADVGNILSPLL